MTPKEKAKMFFWIFLSVSVGAWLIAAAATSVANGTHDLFFDESFGFLYRNSIKDFIAPAAAVFVALGWLNMVWMLGYIKRGSAFSLKRFVVALTPVVLIFTFLTLFRMYVMDSYLGTEYFSALSTFISGLLLFHQSGFVLGASTFYLYDTMRREAQKSTLK